MPVTMCPSAEQLAAFQAGKLLHEDIDSIAEHLDECTTCQAALDIVNTVSDSLMREMKQAHETDTFANESGCHRAVAQVEALINGDATQTRDDTSEPSEAPPRSAPPSKVLGKYQLHELIGRGGMGEVYRATHTVMKKVVAVKLLSAARIDRPDAVARFRREIEAAARLDHPHIVRASDADSADGQHFLVMEWLEGLDLARLVRENGPLPVKQACDFIRQAALGLECAHQHGLVHRDVKPSNLMLTTVAGRPVIKVLDLGLALLNDGVATEGDLTSSGQVMGTYDFIAPEQAMELHTVDARADMYSLGCTFYYLLTGRVPFQGKSEAKKLLAHQLGTVTPMTKYRGDLPPEVIAVVSKMMAKDPAERCQTMVEVSTALQLLLTGSEMRGGPSTSMPISGISVPARSPGRRRVLIGTCLMALVATSVAGVVVIIRDRDGNEIGRLKVPDGASVLIQDDKKQVRPDANAERESQDRIKAAQHLANAREAKRKNSHDVVIAESSEVLRLQPDNVDALMMRGVSRMEVRKQQEAIRDLEAVIRLELTNYDAHQILGLAYDNTSQFEKCIAAESICINQDPNWWQAILCRGRAFALLGQYTEALADFDRLIQLRLTYEDYGQWLGRFHQWRSRVHRSLGNETEGEKDKAAAIRLDKMLANATFDSFQRPALQRFAGHGHALGVTFSSKGESLYSCGRDQAIRCWDIATGKEIRRFEGHTREILALAISPDDRWLASGSRDGTARLWEARTGKLTRIIQDRYDECWGVAFSPNSSRMAADGGGNGTKPAVVSDVSSGKTVAKAAGHATVLTFHPDGKSFLGGTSDGLLQAFDASSGKVLKRLVGHNYWIRKVAISPNGKIAASVSSFAPYGEPRPDDEDFVNLWDWSAGTKKQVLRGHVRRVWGLAFSPDSLLLATGGWDDKTVRLWEVATAKEIWRVDCASRITDVAYSPNGTEVAAACDDGMIRLWRLPPEVSKRKR